MKTNKKAIYAKYGIQFKNGKIYAPELGFIAELLKEGNSKTGKAVYTFSILPGTGKVEIDFNGKHIEVIGTCICNCVGCYAQTGFYKMNSVIQSMTINTWLVNNYPEFVENAINAQLEIIGRGEIRIHAAGDFNTKKPEIYTNMWRKIAEKNNTFRFWTYTKMKQYESLFDGLKNANIVKSIIPGIGFNFGHCGYIINAYYTLKELGKKFISVNVELIKRNIVRIAVFAPHMITCFSWNTLPTIKPNRIHYMKS